jgi:hypothetical protein
MNGPRPTRPPLLLVLALAACMSLIGCGGDEDAPGTAGEDPGTWRTEASEACEAGTEEAVALPLPQNRRETVEDARAMAEILSTARATIGSLGAPEELAEEADAYLAELDEDIAILEQVVRKGRPPSGGGEGATLLDESAGQAALELDLPACAAFANAAARTP